MEAAASQTSDHEITVLRHKPLTVLLLTAMLVLGAGAALGQTTSVAYHGRLTDSGTPANGNYDLQFTSWDMASGGTQQPQPNPVTVSLTSINVSNGSFSVTLDLGAKAKTNDVVRYIHRKVNGGGKYIEVHTDNGRIVIR